MFAVRYPTLPQYKGVDHYLRFHDHGGVSRTAKIEDASRWLTGELARAAYRWNFRDPSDDAHDHGEVVELETVLRVKCVVDRF